MGVRCVAGSTHDLTAARELVLPQARPYLKKLPILADSGYEGAGAGVLDVEGVDLLPAVRVIAVATLPQRDDHDDRLPGCEAVAGHGVAGYAEPGRRKS